MQDLLGIALRIAVMYAYALIIVRLAGKRTIGAIAPIDLAVTIIIGDMFDDIFWSEIPLAKGLVGLTTIVVLHISVSYLGYRSKTVDHILGADRVVLARLGRPVHEGLRSERLREADLLSHLRLQKVERVDEVKVCSFEPSGHVSVLMQEEHKSAEKRDLPALRERMR